MGESVTNRFAKFVSQKISKIRWRPITNELIQESSEFATGSWDNDTNKLCLWKIEDRSTINESELSEDPPQIEIEPVLQCEERHEGDTTDLVYLPNDQLLTSSSNGSVQLYKYDNNLQKIALLNVWQSLHNHGKCGCPCTSIAMKGTDTFASVGEDGRLCFINVEQRQPLRVIEKADSCTLNAASFLKQTEVAAVTSVGQLKVWDLRQSSDDPARVFLPSGEMTSLHCLDKHPTQPHIVCTGGQDGALTIWDMRQDRFPVTVLQAHSSDMWEVKFHPTNPDNLITCSEDGSVWHWDASSISSGTDKNKDFNMLTNASSFMNTPSINNLKSDNHNMSYTSPWLASEASKHRMDITDLLTGNIMPVNSLDVQGNSLICATDGEQIYTISNLVIR